MLKLINNDYETELIVNAHPDGAIITIAQSKEKRLRYIITNNQIPNIINELQNHHREVK